MKKLLWLGLGPIVLAAAVSTTAQNPPAPQSIVLYSPIQYNHDFDRASVDLERAAYASRFKFGDLGYGLLRVGSELDWLEISIAQDRRTAIIDLGPHAWTDSLTVPWVEPLAKLKPGEARQVFVNSSGAPGKGASGGKSYEGLSALPSGGGTNPDACCDTPISIGTVDRTSVRDSSHQPKRPAGVQTSPNIMRAILGHMYVVHVVDDRRDFYALFRIDALQPGDNCTIAWKMIPPPLQPTTVKK